MSGEREPENSTSQPLNKNHGNQKLKIRFGYKSSILIFLNGQNKSDSFPFVKQRAGASASAAVAAAVAVAVVDDERVKAKRKQTGMKDEDGGGLGVPQGEDRLYRTPEGRGLEALRKFSM
ncbi:hypothetical protein RUM43_010052 [Polyplax serrata]|uniref:Uncharacterized protein n=1 Tax=Polyplax serrata TaxID=468196 RepID=A0AAN8PK99_POLSC